MSDRITGDKDVPERAKHPLTGPHPMLTVSDIDAAIDYYRRVLGFFLEWAAYDDDDGAGGIANLWRGQLSLFVRTHGGFGPSCIYCHLPTRQDVDTLHADLERHGARVTSPPANRPWHNYEMWIEDLDGNRLTFASHVDDDGNIP